MAESLATSWVVLPTQEKEPPKRAKGERELYAAILERALHDLEYRGFSKARTSARYWVIEGDVGYVTFDQCCWFLGLDADLTRARILAGRFHFQRRGQRARREPLRHWKSEAL
jgi:hypothetical protein